MSEAYNGRGNILSHLGKHEMALEDFDRALALDSERAGVYINRGAANIAMKRHKEAIKDFSAAIQLGVAFERAWALCQRGFVKKEMRNPNGAREDLKKPGKWPGEREMRALPR